MDRRTQIVDLLKDWGIAGAITVVILGAWTLLRPEPVATGNEAPALVSPFVDGAAFDLSTETADVVIVNFWATWCGPCRAEIPEFTAFAQEHPDVRVLGVSVDDDLQPAQLARAAKQLGIGYPVLHDRDGRARGAWGVDSFPTTFVLDRAHHVVRSRVGMTNRRWLEEAADEARGR